MSGSWHFDYIAILIHLMDILPNDPLRFRQLTATPLSTYRLERTITSISPYRMPKVYEKAGSDRHNGRVEQTFSCTFFCEL
jgi:hypothetical protein